MGGRHITSPALVGRQHELRQLQDAASAGSAAPTLVMIRGEAGIGKTRLVEEFSAWVRAEGGRVLSGGCVVLGGDHLPYAPVIEALRGLAREPEPGVDLPSELGRLAPELGARPGARDADQGAVFEALLRLLEALAERRAPVVLVIEDLHWADPATQRLLPFLVQNVRPGRVLVVGTVRDEEVHRTHSFWPLLVELERRSQVESIGLGALDLDQISVQLTHLLEGVPTPELVDRIARRSEGNPFFIEELSAVRDGARDLPTSIKALFLQRVATMPEAVVTLVRHVALLGSHADDELIGAVAGLTDHDLTSALRTCVENGILVVDDLDDGYRLRHALMGEAIAGDMLPIERVRAHARLAEVLEKRLDPDDASSATQVAHHLLAANDLERGLFAAVRAGDAATGIAAHVIAHLHYERALAIWDRVGQPEERTGIDRARLLERAGVAARNGGDSARAAQLLRSAIEEVDERTDPVRAGVLYELLGGTLGFGLEVAESDQAFRRALELVPAHPPSVERARVLAGYGNLLTVTDRLVDGQPFLREAVAVARVVGDRAAEARALAGLGTSLGVLESEAKAIEALERAVALGEELADASVLGSAYNNLVWTLQNALRYQEALHIGLRAIDRLRSMGMGLVAGSALVANTTETLIMLGRSEEAAQLLEERREARAVPAAAAMIENARFMLEILRGNTAAAEVIAASIEARLQHHREEPEDLAQVREWTAVLAMITGDVGLARRHVDEGLAMCVDLDDPRFVLNLAAVGLRIEGDLAAIGQANAQRVTRMTHIAKVAGARVVSAGARLARDLCRAEGTRATAQPDPTTWRDIVARWTEAGAAWPAAYARFRQGEASALMGDSVRAADLLARALEEAETMGAAPLAGDIRDVARRAHIDLAGRIEDAGAPSTLGLTAREAEVLRLVAEGRTNPQIAEALFISRKTASTHVSKILMKLGVKTRGEAAAAAHRLGLTD